MIYNKGVGPVGGRMGFGDREHVRAVEMIIDTTVGVKVTI